MGDDGSEESGLKSRIFLVEDHPIMRQGLVQVINSQPDMVVCGEADDFQSAKRKITGANLDLVIIDISLPGKNGLELIKDLKPLYPSLKTLVLSMHDEALYAERVLRAGGRGYVMKREGVERLLRAIRQVLRGDIYLSDGMSEKILASFSGDSVSVNQSQLQRLTDREFEIFQLIGQGKATREIAETLHVSVKTVEAHRANIKEKLKFKTAPEMVRFAIRWEESKTESRS